ncbi:MAG: hypothetical protein FWG71_09630 [Synergistaceae bacterium]|nr:hypothetical protein [Synergistaceae bacterium]
MKKWASFLVTVWIVFSVARGCVWADEADEAEKNEELTISELFDRVFSVPPGLPEEVSPDLWVSADEYPHEGGDALNELMRSLIKGRTFDKDLYGVEGNYEIIGEAGGRLEKGGEIKRIRLIALRHEAGAYDRGLLLEIIPPEGDSFVIPLPDDVRGIQSSISVKNFISRDKSEILLTVYSGRWGERFLIIAAAGRDGEIIMDTRTTRIPAVVGRFFNDYRAEIIVRETGERAMIDLSPRKAVYNRRLVYNEGGSLRSGVRVWVDRFSKFEPVDVDGDGVFEIRQIIDLSGSGRADRIAYVEATLKYAGSGWKVIDSWIAPARDLNKIPLPRRIN